MGKLEEAKEILTLIGMPKQQCNDRSAYTLLSLAKIAKNDSWDRATQDYMRIVDMMTYMATNYNKVYAANSRETIKKQTIHQFRDGAIVVSNTDDIERATNSPAYSYRLADEFLKLLQSYKTESFQAILEKFITTQGTLIQKYSSERNSVRIPVNINGRELTFSPGSHNQLQKLIIEDFGSIHAPGSEVLYVGYTENKDLVKNISKLTELGIIITDHDKLPDVVLYSPDLNALHFIESVTSVGPMSPKRILEIEDMLKNCNCKKEFVTAFLDFKAYKKFISEIAWETHIWISEIPEHMIHLNGDKYRDIFK